MPEAIEYPIFEHYYYGGLTGTYYEEKRHNAFFLGAKTPDDQLHLGKWPVVYHYGQDFFQVLGAVHYTAFCHHGQLAPAQRTDLDVHQRRFLREAMYYNVQDFSELGPRWKREPDAEMRRLFQLTFLEQAIGWLRTYFDKMYLLDTAKVHSDDPWTYAV